MPFLSIDKVRLDGIACCVPEGIESNYDYELITPKERNMLVKTTGIEQRRIAVEGQTTSDLCFGAAEKLLNDLDWDRDQVDLLVFVSQSPDYFTPASSIILQDRLGLSKSCMAFDINLGCSGYVYGLSVAASLVQSGAMKKALLLVGDKSSSAASRTDKSTWPLFGDAGSATALSFDESASKMHFNLQSDGSGHESIIIYEGGVRNPPSPDTFNVEEIGPGISRHKANLVLNGLDVFSFSMREVAPNIKSLLSYLEETTDDYQYYVFHQANKLMNENIRKKLKLPPEKVPYSLQQFGNTSSASIPLTIVHQLKQNLNEQSIKCILSGFGVGLSWGSVALELDNIICSELVELSPDVYNQSIK